MYKISVPVMNANVTRCGREKVLKDSIQNVYFWRLTDMRRIKKSAGR